MDRLRPPRIWTFGALLSLLLPGLGRADDVYLTNGKVYEDVIAERTADGIRIDLAFGKLVLPEAQVERIVSSEAPLETFRRLEQSLESNDGSAQGWLDLALWSRSNGLAHGSKEAALKAADMDPGLEGLRPLMAELGRVYDAELDRWVTEAQHLRSRGFVEVDGRWLNPAELEAHLALRREEERQQRELATARALQQVAENLERAERRAEQARQDELMAEALRQSQSQTVHYPIFVIQPGWSRPATAPSRRAPHRSDHEPASVTYRRLANRQPGSFLPVSQYNPAPEPPATPSFAPEPEPRRPHTTSSRSTDGS
ncbi:MAG: hypothetical protein K8J08_10250 [Thermoanaerobaculia bacterium]|nr:hypothetical protein [Thermoanaerobaculia bacterium]